MLVEREGILEVIVEMSGHDVDGKRPESEMGAASAKT